MDKQVQIEIGGRCGNQLFQYAYARALLKNYFPDYKIKCSFRNVYKSGRKEDGWENSLQYFNLDYSEEVSKCHIDFVQKVICCLFYGFKLIFPDDVEIKMQPFLNRFGIYAMRKSYYVPVGKSNAKNIYCRGRFEAHEYFDCIREDLLREFTPKFPTMEHNKKLLLDISSHESVCVTIRRGDFLYKGNEQFNVCSEHYYQEAMKRIVEEIPYAKFFVFTDDVKGVKDHFSFPYEVVFESGDDPVWEKLRLMYSCKHFIIGNSTFSWWAQYLGRNPSKVVYAPKRWRNSDEDCSGMYLPYMKYID